MTLPLVERLRTEASTWSPFDPGSADLVTLLCEAADALERVEMLLSIELKTVMCSACRHRGDLCTCSPKLCDNIRAALRGPEKGEG